MPLYFHPLYTDGIHPDARFPRDRYRLIAERFSHGGRAELVDVRTAPMAAPHEVARAHDTDYVHRFISGEMSLAERRRVGLRPWTDLLIPRMLHIMGGAIAGLADVMRSGGVAANMAGGTHHAHFDAGSGFCVFNDLAICARTAQEIYGVERIAIIDLDVHQGDGTATILKDDPGIFMLSVHCEANFPFRKAQSTLDVGLAEQTGDTQFLAAVRDALQPVAAFEPQLVLFQAGVDGLETDALGRLAISRAGMKRRNDLVFDACIEWQTPCVVFMGGGYSKPIEHTVDAFTDLFVQASQTHLRLTTNKPRTSNSAGP